MMQLVNWPGDCGADNLINRDDIARTSPSLNIRRGRLISCDYDITHEDVVEARHFEDEVFVYGFHDSAPRLQVKDGGTYGIPYRALCVKGIDNL